MRMGLAMESRMCIAAAAACSVWELQGMMMWMRVMWMLLQAGGHRHPVRVPYRFLRLSLIQMLTVLTGATVVCVAGTRMITLEGPIWARISPLAGEICRDVVGEGATETAEDLLLAVLVLLRHLWAKWSGRGQHRNQERRLLQSFHRPTLLVLPLPKEQQFQARPSRSLLQYPLRLFQCVEVHRRPHRIRRRSSHLRPAGAGRRRTKIYKCTREAGRAHGHRQSSIGMV